MTRKIPVTLLLTWLLIPPHVLWGLINTSGFVSIFLYAPFGREFVAGVIVNLIMALGAIVSCIALFDPGPFRGALKVFWSRIFAVLWNFLNSIWLVWIVYSNHEGDIWMLVAQLLLALVTFSVLMLYAVEDTSSKKKA